MRRRRKSSAGQPAGDDVTDQPNTPPAGDNARGDKDFAHRDIGPLLRGWEYEAGAINVRKIHGLDGATKLQMRLDLGLLQMEISGRPDGQRPHGFESLLEYFERQLQDHRSRNGTDLGFHLTPAQCQSLREEASMYYYRYLGLLVLEDYHAVVRDTSRNLRVLDLCGQYASKDEDRLVLEQYRPYILMMNARAKASILYDEQRLAEAVDVIRATLRQIKKFFARFGQEEAYKHSGEVKVLKRLGRDIKRKLPVDPVDKLRKQLGEAVRAERYEEAARLRDELLGHDPGALDQLTNRP